MKILIAGDIVSSPGRNAFTRTVERIRETRGADLIIANAENAAGGNGLLPRLAEGLFKQGADVITLGDHTWDQKDLIPYLDEEWRVIRPANFASECPGFGCCVSLKNGVRYAVISLMGRTFMKFPTACPFKTADQLLKRDDVKNCSVVIVDFHAEATSEKVIMGRYLDGRVSAVVGTHTHIQTSDECVLEKGTGYITDLGMTGPINSILGRQYKPVLNTFLTGMPSRFDIKKGPGVFEGVWLEVDDLTGQCQTIERIRESMETR